ncbi:hypothetical protein C5167_023053 [Papaver somniferum]|uniref:Bet v I/Major latex protein domain-containing protein n=1 Tax=Papaver somniferum TaxID=3469 RepID=A0A4Y7JNP1_PAPSO|nr:major latex protein 15-like [Papaver somniferum]RZC61295.1 hypothetical protein C5167_023053 [Papaver somniferum]
MAQLHKLGFETEIKCSADKFFGMFSHNITQLPKCVPNIYKSVEVIQGDETSIGSIKLWKYDVEGREMIVKEKVTAFDKEKRSITHEMVEGELANYYKAIAVKLDVVPKQGAAGTASLVTWSLEFEKVNEDIPNPTAYIDALKLTTMEVSSQLC